MSSIPPAQASLYSPLAHGITAIESGYFRPGYDVAYLMVENGRAAFIDSGVNASLPHMLGALALRGLSVDDVDWVILTHVHLDHAGGAGALMAVLPNARLAVHPRGVRHMIDPGPLLQAVRAVYGDEVTQREYGELIPVAAERIESLDDGQVLHLAGRALTITYSPGHARHHVCIWDERSRGWFTGDAFGLCLPEFRTAEGHAVIPTTSPSQFEPGPYHETIAKLMARAPRAMYPTHSGEVLHPERLAPCLLAQIDAMVDAARSSGAGEGGVLRMQDAFCAIYLQALHAQGWHGSEATVREVLQVDLKLNAEGVKLWLDREPQPGPTP